MKTDQYFGLKINFCPKTFSLLLAIGAIIAAVFPLTGCSMNYNGEDLFYSVGCSECHTFKGRGGRLAPDLSAVTNMRSDSWIESYLQDPKKINPLSRMPSFKHLSSSKRRAIVAFLKN